MEKWRNSHVQRETGQASLLWYIEWSGRVTLDIYSPHCVMSALTQCRCTDTVLVLSASSYCITILGPFHTFVLALLIGCRHFFLKYHDQVSFEVSPQ